MKKRCLAAAAVVSAVGLFMMPVMAKTFDDVSESDWYYGAVEASSHSGILIGVDDTHFSPDKSLSVAEAVTAAARIHASLNGTSITPASEGLWYTPYAEYAVKNGILKEEEQSDLPNVCERCFAAVLLDRALPDGQKTAVNEVEKIPDVSEKMPEHDAVLAMYRAGIMMGSDEYGFFRPYDGFTRAEESAVIQRILTPQSRLNKTLQRISDDDAYALIIMDTLNNPKEGIASGFSLDNRGGYPRSKLSGDYVGLIDVSEKDGTALIREMNDVSTGFIEWEMNLSLAGELNDIEVSLENPDGMPVYSLCVKDGKWCLRQKDKTEQMIASAKEGGLVLHIFTDLDNGIAKTSFDNVNFTVAALLTEPADTVLRTLRISTGREDCTNVKIERIHADVNYAVNEDGVGYYQSSMPDWTLENAMIDTAQTLRIEKNGSACKSFRSVSGKVIAETDFLLDNRQSMNISLLDGRKTVVLFYSDNKSLYANGEKVYDYVGNVWYHLRLEADTDTQTVLVKLNGRKLAEVPFLGKAASFDGIKLENGSAFSVPFDNIKVFAKPYHEDYVPKPIQPAGADDYTIGVNVCSLWRNGTSFDWACISAYDEPLIGYYDEGIPETADWEIKFMVEHGIDFQAFCWFPDTINGPIKEPRNAYQLHDAYKNAEYSDEMKYCLILEAANSALPAGLDVWKKYTVPYLIEHYFKDERYMTVDNRLLFYVFGAYRLADAGAFGHADTVREAFDYLEEEVKKLGFDGMLYISCGTADAVVAQMGFDAFSAYSWSQEGCEFEVNRDKNLSFNGSGGLYAIPTVSVGFNQVAWAHERTPLITVNDYEQAHLWVRDMYLPSFAVTQPWQKNFVMLSTWNEFGEGTYIMPCENNNGFGYLDVVRKVYTKETESESVDVLPTENQKKRITRLYPQNEHLLRPYGGDLKNYTPSVSIDLNDKPFSTGSIENYKQKNGVITGTGVGDAIILITPDKEISLDKSQVLRITADIPRGDVIQVYYTTASSTNYEEEKSLYLQSKGDGFHTYVFDFSGQPKWTGTLRQLRIDPVSYYGKKFTIKAIDFTEDAYEYPSSLYINGEKLSLHVPYASVNGQTLVGFDPLLAMDYYLGMYHEWQRDDGTLTLYVNDHTLTFTVGKDTYMLDGEEKPLGYTMYLTDALPMLPMKQVCTDVGFICSVNDEGVIEITTHQKDHYQKMHDRKAGSWDFEIFGDTEGFDSEHMTLSTGMDGYMTAKSVSNTEDPVIWYRKPLSLTAEKYKAVEFRIRYRYDLDKPNDMAIYYLTDVDSAWNEDKCIYVHLDSIDTGSDFEVYRVDLTQMPAWKNTITNIRFDPFNAVGQMDVDYIRFIEDENYVDPRDRPFGINGGDAENVDKSPFYSANANISLTEDPENPDNHCYRVLSLGGASYVYTRYDVYFTKGKTYQIDYDLKIAAFDSNTELADDFTAIINCNMRYADTAGGTDHIVGGTTLKVTDGWCHFSATYKLNEVYDEKTYGQFCIYSNPVDNLGVGYYIDNVTVKELG